MEVVYETMTMKAPMVMLHTHTHTHTHTEIAMKNRMVLGRHGKTSESSQLGCGSNGLQVKTSYFKRVKKGFGSIKL